MGASADQWKLHRDIAREVPEAPGRIGYTALQKAVGVRQGGRVKRAVSTLVALDVLQWEGVRQGRAVAQGPRDLDAVLADGIMPMPEREIATYPLLTAALDACITAWHERRHDPIDTSGGTTSVGDGVWTYNTSSLRGPSERTAKDFTRPDLTVVVDLEFTHLGSWNDIHAVEVKPYWAVTRSALFEAAAQAALGRCTFSWLLVWVPEPDPAHFRPEHVALIADAQSRLCDIAAEAGDLGLGFIVARTLGEDAVLDLTVEPRRRVMEPRAADDLFEALGRSDSTSGQSGQGDR